MRKLINSLAVRFHIWNQKRLLEAQSFLINDKEYVTLTLKNISSSVEASSKNAEMETLVQMLDAVRQDRTLSKEPN